MDLNPYLAPALGPQAKDWLTTARNAVKAGGKANLPVLFAQLARRVGRARLEPVTVDEGDARVDLGAWRACDGVGALLLQEAEAGDDDLVDLYLHGDMEERAIVLRSLALRPVTPATIRLLGEVQRTNTVLHVEAGALDSNLAVRALHAAGEDTGFTREAFRRLVLKVAFLDLPAWRMFGAFDEAEADLSAMLRDYATEREAANRTIWKDTYRFLGRAPAPGGVARILGGLEHGDDETRLAAAEALVALGRPDLAPFARERLEREPRETIRKLLERAAAL